MELYYTALKPPPKTVTFIDGLTRSITMKFLEWLLLPFDLTDALVALVKVSDSTAALLTKTSLHFP